MTHQFNAVSYTHLLMCCICTFDCRLYLPSSCRPTVTIFVKWNNTWACCVKLPDGQTSMEYTECICNVFTLQSISQERSNNYRCEITILPVHFTELSTSIYIKLRLSVLCVLQKERICKKKGQRKKDINRAHECSKNTLYLKVGWRCLEYLTLRPVVQELFTWFSIYSWLLNQLEDVYRFSRGSLLLGAEPNRWISNSSDGGKKKIWETVGN